MNNIINESKSGEINNIVNSSAIIYAHLMKFLSQDNLLTGWVGTIKEHVNQLSCITNKTYWREVKSDIKKLEKIKRRAISIFEDDGNENGEQFYTLVHNEFYDIEMFKDREKVKQYMIRLCNKKKNSDMEDYINSNM